MDVKQIFLLSLLLSRSCIAPLLGRHGRASLPSTDSVLQRIQRSLVNTREVLSSNSNPTQDQLSETATELRSLIRNLHRIESEIDQTPYESTHTAIEAVINGVERLERRASSRRCHKHGQSTMTHEVIKFTLVLTWTPVDYHKEVFFPV